MRKIDLRVLPILFIIYLAAFLDRCVELAAWPRSACCSQLFRVNIGNALTLDLPKDLHLVGNQSNVALTIFFVPYVLFEIPSNILMKRFQPHVWCALSSPKPTFWRQLLMFVLQYPGVS